MQQKIRGQLYALVDPNYRQFIQKLFPGVSNILGVRLPHLKKMAQCIAKTNGEDYLKDAADDSLEEVILQGLVIGYVTIDIKQRLHWIKNFVCKINHWGICDTFCRALKFKSEDKVVVWNFLQPFLCDHRPYFLRFAIVMLFKFIDDEHIDAIFSIVSKVHHEHRYVKLAIAWLISECCVHFPEKTLIFLESEPLDLWTQRIAIRKIKASFRIDPFIKRKF
ncbi:MAG: DNA alkylation repair protein [Puniceicoccales bacterium]|jgi:3-methyladenine DNA glycosylase AlkD|nr:DNA alkylation repair protein [Puniceicoccales bacterium]